MFCERNVHLAGHSHALVQVADYDYLHDNNSVKLRELTLLSPITDSGWSIVHGHSARTRSLLRCMLLVQCNPWRHCHFAVHSFINSLIIRPSASSFQALIARNRPSMISPTTSSQKASASRVPSSCTSSLVYIYS